MGHFVSSPREKEKWTEELGRGKREIEDEGKELLTCLLPPSTASKVGPFITKTYLYTFDPLQPHFYTVKLGFTGV